MAWIFTSSKDKMTLNLEGIGVVPFCVSFNWIDPFPLGSHSPSVAAVIVGASFEIAKAIKQKIVKSFFILNKNN